jgi:hypothetical protein
MPEPIVDDQDETVTLPSGKKAVVPPPEGKSSPTYNALPDEGGDTPYTSDFLKRFDPSATKGLTNSLAGIERERGAALQKSSGEINSRMEHDRAQMERAFGAEAASANSIPPMWNADKERQERISDPIANFGSIGSIFGLIASAFTKTPMTSALNASAAAMTAIHDHDEEGYKSAYEAWKENTSLALKRFGMERELFEDTNKLMDHDINQWKVQTLAQAAQFDNKKVIAMLDAGMDDKILEMQASQVRAAEGLVKAQEEFEAFDVRRTIFSAQSKAWDQAHPDAKPQEKAQARLDILQGIGEGRANLQEDLLRQYRLDHPGATAQEQADFLKQNQVGKPGSVGAPTKEKEIARRINAWAKAHPDATEDEIDAADDQIRKDVADASQPTMTPHDRLATESSVGQYKEAQTKLDTTIKSLETHVGEAGLAGKATRMGERIGNVFGNNDTDREQFMRDIQFLRANAQKLLFDRNGRPLAGDSDRINDIIGGINLGDTTANTLRSLREVKKVLDRLEKEKEDQLGGKWKADTSASPSAPDSGAKPAWEEAPIVGQ